MLILKSNIFEQFPEVIFGSSTKIGLGRLSPYYFNLSLSVGDNPDLVRENRNSFFNQLGLDTNSVVLQRQIHSDIITVVNSGGDCGESDAMITDRKNLGLAISTADCTPIFIYDRKQRVIAGIHSGWRGTQKLILEKTLEKLESNFGSEPENLFAYIGPSISQSNYEVGSEVAEYFDEKYTVPKNGKFLLDVAANNYDILINYGLLPNHIQKSNLCTFSLSNLLHSYRRDGQKSGRTLGVIAIK